MASSTSVYFSPDSQRLAAVCARSVLLIDVSSGRSKQIKYPGEFFGSLHWISDAEIAFSTSDFSTSDEKAVQFWRLKAHAPPHARQRVYSETDRWARPHEALPPGLSYHRWSPSGRYVIFESTAGREDRARCLLDLGSGDIRTFPFAVDHVCWKPDGSAFLAEDAFGETKRILLVDPASGAATDLTDDFKAALGEDLTITIVSERWTPDGRYIILYRTNATPPRSDSEGWRFSHTGYVVQPRPFKVILEKDRILRWSPIPGWVLVQGGNEFTWTDYAATQTVQVQGWPNDWTWSPDGIHAAVIRKGRPVVFEPTLPVGRVSAKEPGTQDSSR